MSVFVREAAPDISGDISLECKHFFSGAALYAEERICLSLTPAGVAVGSETLHGYVKESIGYVLTLPKPKAKLKKG